MSIGVWIEKITAQTWEQNIKELILKPLGMTQTNLSVTESRSIEDLALPYFGEQEMPFKNIDPIGPAGSINSNMNDMVKWVSLHLNHGRTESGRALLSPQAHERLFKAETDAGTLLPGSQNIQYGLGWFLSEINKSKVIWHGGNIDGFSSFVSFVPEKNLGVVILTNEAQGNLFEFPISVPANETHPEIKLLPLLVYEDLLGFSESGHNQFAQYQLPVADTVSFFNLAAPALVSFSNPLKNEVQLKEYSVFDSLEMLLSPKFSKETVRTMPPDLPQYAGSYSEKAYGDIGISLSNGQLQLNYYANHWALNPLEASDQFVIEFINEGQNAKIPVQFVRENGQITALQIPFEAQVDPIHFSRK